MGQEHLHDYTFICQDEGSGTYFETSCMKATKADRSVPSTFDSMQLLFLYWAIPIKCFVSHHPPSREGVSDGGAKKN